MTYLEVRRNVIWVREPRVCPSRCLRHLREDNPIRSKPKRAIFELLIFERLASSALVSAFIRKSLGDTLFTCVSRPPLRWPSARFFGDLDRIRMSSRS